MQLEPASTEMESRTVGRRVSHCRVEPRRNGRL